jgi:surface protein
MELYLNLMPDLRDIVTGYFGDVIFIQSSGFSQGNEVEFATAEEFRKSEAINCIFINFEITSIDHIRAPDIPNTLLKCSGIPKIKTHTLASMFENSKFSGDISQWDVSNVTTMRFMFWESQFKGDISKWDVSKVTSMYGMFYNSPFNGDLSQWDVSNVVNMASMFSNSLFNNPSLLTWNVSSVDTMYAMFENLKFNGDLSQWDVSSVTNMECMFSGSKFNSDISQWDVSNVENMHWMFSGSKMKKITVQSWGNFKNHAIDALFK